MRVEQIYTGCLAHAAYYVQSDGEAAIFDPLREVAPYISKASEGNAVIKYVFETHFHADFVSGHLDLQRKTGAAIVFGPGAVPNYEAVIAGDGEVFSIGRAKVKAIHTPGHTMESTTYLLIDEQGKEHGIITGDTLLIGDVGRPDLAQHVAAELSQDKLARLLYHSLRSKIMPLEDSLIVYPNHGRGSACGKMMSSATTDTLGNQKNSNYALRSDMGEEEFVREVLEGLAKPPGYFPKNVLLNSNGYPSLDTILERGMTPLDAVQFGALAGEGGAVVLDTRNARDFAKGFIPNSINIGLDGSFAGWAGELLDISQQIVIIAEAGKEEESIIRLSRVGYDATAGYLKGGIDAWLQAGNAVGTLSRITAGSLEALYPEEPLIFDVRKKSEYDSEHVIGAINIPLNEMDAQMACFPADTPFVLYCAGGYRSMIAASLLRQRGYNNFSDIIGGFAAIAKTGIPRTAYACPTSLL